MSVAFTSVRMTFLAICPLSDIIHLKPDPFKNKGADKSPLIYL